MTETAAKYLSLPFKEAIRFFREKLSIPTERWDELWAEQHARAFTVAGAMEEALLESLREAVDQVITEGTTLAEFKNRFDDIVAVHGWEHTGERAWRAAIIYQTNLSTSYAAGRWHQQTSPAVKRVRPYLRYLPSKSANPNKAHMRWYNLVLPVDHEFWKTHYPPNDWGCKCGVTSVTEKQLEKNQGKWRTEAPEVRMVEHVNKKTGQVTEAPEGIGPGWDYNPGREWKD